MTPHTSLIIAITLIISIITAGCASQAPTPLPTVGQTPETQQVPTNNTSTNAVEINMTAENFQFTPNVINAKKGDHIIIHIVQSDDDHGIAINGYNQQVTFGSGTFSTNAPTLEFIADKTGTFTFFCNVPCGPGHREMKGTLVVQ